MFRTAIIAATLGATLSTFPTIQAGETAPEVKPAVITPPSGPGIPTITPEVTWTQKQKASYLIGTQMGKSLKQIKDEIEPELVLLALKDTLAGRPSPFSAQEEQQVMQKFQQDMQAGEAKRAGDRKGVNTTWLAENGKKPGVKTIASGLQYEVLATGKGQQAAMGKTVTVHYTGTMLDGTEFDSSVKRGQPADFPLNPGGLIQGWLEAIPLMKEGDRWKLYIPSDLAYGERGNRGIPPNSLLIFEVELIKVAAAPAPAIPGVK